jgi:hypothetical protein
MQQIKLALALLSVALLAGCGAPLPASVKGGECRVFRAAIVETCGLTQSDQDIIDENAERGVASCQWQRPAPRAPSCEAIRAEIAALRASVSKQVAEAKPKPRTIPELLRWRNER